MAVLSTRCLHHHWLRSFHRVPWCQPWSRGPCRALKIPLAAPAFPAPCFAQSAFTFHHHVRWSASHTFPCSHASFAAFAPACVLKLTKPKHLQRAAIYSPQSLLHYRSYAHAIASAGEPCPLELHPQKASDRGCPSGCRANFTLSTSPYASNLRHGLSSKAHGHSIRRTVLTTNTANAKTIQCNERKQIA